MVQTIDKIKGLITENRIIAGSIVVLILIGLCSKSWDVFIKSIIGLAGLIFAYFQWQINKQNTKTNVDRLRLDLFDKRIKVYNGFIDIISVIVRDDEIEQKNISVFNLKRMEADFFFDDDISAYGEEIYKKALEFKRVSRRLKNYSGDHESEEYDELYSKKDDLGLWFTEQYGPCKELFVKYIGFKVQADK